MAQHAGTVSQLSGSTINSLALGDEIIISDLPSNISLIGQGTIDISQNGEIRIDTDEDGDYDMIINAALPSGALLKLSSASVIDNNGISENQIVISASDDDIVLPELAVETNLTHTIYPSPGSNPGTTLSVSGDVFVISDGYNSIGAQNAGRAYVASASTGNLLFTLSDPSPTSFDTFGNIVAISGSASPQNNPQDFAILVSKMGDDTHGDNAGQAYLYSATDGSLLHTFSAPNARGGERFGFNLDFDASVNAVVISAPGTYDAGDGVVYLFSSVNGNLVHTFTSPNTNLHFGQEVSVSGQYILINAELGGTLVASTGAERGQAYLYNTFTGGLLHTFTSSKGAGTSYTDDFAERILVSGSNVFLSEIYVENGVTNYALHQYDAVSGALTRTYQKGGDQLFGISMAVSGDYILVGAPSFTDRTGQAFLYNHVTGELVHTFEAPLSPTGAPNPDTPIFGYDVAFDGDDIVISALGTVNGVYVYDFNAAIASDTVILGTDGNDVLDGSANANKISGGDGNDTLIGRSGNDHLDGGLGIDTANYAFAGAGVTVDLSTGEASSDGEGGEDTLTGIEQVTGSAHDDDITGDDEINFLKGNAGEDTLRGGANDDKLLGGDDDDTLYGGDDDDLLLGEDGRDELHGEAGRDTLNGGAGNDNLRGGDGNDIIVGELDNDWLYGDAGQDILNGGDGNDRLYGGDDNDSLIGGRGQDLLDGSDGDDILRGQEDNDSLLGGRGNDTLYGGTNVNDAFSSDDRLYGGDGDDILWGLNGNDILNGDSGADTLLGGDGDDTLNGGAGRDGLRGGAGADTFVFDYSSTGGNPDTIKDFNLGEGDKIDISDLIQSDYNPTSHAIADFIEIRDSGANSLILVDPDGDQIGAGLQWVGTIRNVNGLTDEDALVASGNLIVS